MLQKQPAEKPPRYFIPVVDPAGKRGGIAPEDQRRMFHDSTIGPNPGRGLTH
jgi:hypothetical protein